MSCQEFGLIVYDDVTNSWHGNKFEKWDVSDYQIGLSGLITFDSSWEILMFHVHNGGA